MAVALNGGLWAWGYGGSGQLGLGDDSNRRCPTLVGEESVFPSGVLTAACGDFHTLAVTRQGALWSWGGGGFGDLGHGDMQSIPMPKEVDAQHFGGAKVVSAAAALCHSTALTEDGTLFSWGRREVQVSHGHEHVQHALVPAQIDPPLLHGARVGRCHRLPIEHSLAVAMGMHARLGACCSYASVPGELVHRIVNACAGQPEGQTWEVEGVIRLMGGVGRKM